MVIANQTFPVSPSSFIYPPVPPSVLVVVVSLCPGRHLYSLCPGRHLCPGVLVCNFSLSVLVVIYIPCVPVSRSSFIFPVSRCPSIVVDSFFEFTGRSVNSKFTAKDSRSSGLKVAMIGLKYHRLFLCLWRSPRLSA